MFRILAFFRPWKTKIIVLIDRKSGSDFHQQTAAKKIYKELEWLTYNHLHCFLGSLSFLRYKIVVSLNQQQIEIIIVDMAMLEEEGERNLQYFQERGI